MSLTPTAYNTSRQVAYEVQHGQVDAVYIGGDISYAVGYLGTSMTSLTTSLS